MDCKTLPKQNLLSSPEVCGSALPYPHTVLDPDLLLLDEPFSALDYQTRLTVGDDIGQIIRKEKKTAILVTHDLSEAVSLGDRVIVLSARPASIQQTIPLHFDMQEDTPLLRRNTPEFKIYFNLVWRELNGSE